MGLWDSELWDLISLAQEELACDFLFYPSSAADCSLQQRWLRRSMTWGFLKISSIS